MTPWVLRLIIANIAMFFLQTTRPGLEASLLFVPAQAIIHPWTFVTYMFLHQGIPHILFNMLGLYFLGPQVEARLGAKRFLTLYFISGVAGALLHMLLAPHNAMLGASGAVLGVMLAFAYFWPRERLMIWGVLPVEARVLVGVYAVMALWGGFAPTQGSSAFGLVPGGVANFAHLGGMLGAWLYLRWLDANTGARRFRAKAAPIVADRSLSNWKKVDPTSVHEINRTELNRILDKVNVGG